MHHHTRGTGGKCYCVDMLQFRMQHSNIHGSIHPKDNEIFYKYHQETRTTTTLFRTRKEHDAPSAPTRLVTTTPPMSPGPLRSHPLSGPAGWHGAGGGAHLLWRRGGSERVPVVPLGERRARGGGSQAPFRLRAHPRRLPGRHGGHGPGRGLLPQGAPSANGARSSDYKSRPNAPRPDGAGCIQRPSAPSQHPRPSLCACPLGASPARGAFFNVADGAETTLVYG